MLQPPARALVVAAHPDDAEFGCGGTVRKWIQNGTKVFYLICTNGDKGDDSASHSSQDVAARRAEEQKRAAQILGVSDFVILPRSDGSLFYDDSLRADVVRYVRQWKPDVVITHDPTVVIQDLGGVNHADHRAAGTAAIDAAYPFARGKLQYPEQIAEGLQPHVVRELYIFGSNQPNHFEDVSEQANEKIDALLAHKSQFPDQTSMRTFVLALMEQAGADKGIKYAEAFRVVPLT